MGRLRTSVLRERDYCNSENRIRNGNNNYVRPFRRRREVAGGVTNCSSSDRRNNSRRRHERGGGVYIILTLFVWRRSESIFGRDLLKGESGSASFIHVPTLSPPNLAVRELSATRCFFPPDTDSRNDVVRVRTAYGTRVYFAAVIVARFSALRYRRADNSSHVRAFVSR